MIRYNPNIKTGLTDLEVTERINNHLVNYDTEVKTKSFKFIFLSNIFTLFNFLNFGIALAIFFVHSYKNLLFMGVVFCNTIISIIQEINSKRVIDKLSVIASKKVNVIRNRQEQTLSLNDIVLDDIIKLKIGNQVVTDAIIKEGTVLVDESFITGESEYIEKHIGDLLLSGSFIVSGGCTCQVEHIGEDNYTSKISKEAKYIKKVNSVIMDSLNKIVKFVSIIIVPLGLILFLRQYHLEQGLQDAVIKTAAAIISMIPEGLVLLTSTVLAVSVIRLGKKRVLVQDLYCIETLARVDTICLDKTGTITEGNLELEKVIALDKHYSIEDILSSMSTLMNDNATMKAIHNQYHHEVKWEYLEKIAFSSKTKYSGIIYRNKGTFLLGAPEFLTKDNQILKQIKQYDKYRTLILMHSNSFKKNDLNVLEPVAIILLKDKIRKSAINTLGYFKMQGVDIKIISGDSVSTVGAIAKSVHMDNVNCLDMSTVNESDNMQELAEKYNVFCRVSPTQKKTLILALKNNNHTVAMTGDGVNDVLALKEADCSIVMASGSDAARNVSQIILLDSNFDAVTNILYEGRRTINNIERSATLFLTKTLYATILAILFLFISMDYPFQPIQLSLVSTITIGIPSFVLALQPNKNKVTGNFLLNIISKSIPSAITIVIDIIFAMIVGYLFHLSDDEISTIAISLVAFTGFILLFKLCYPFNKLRITLYIGLIFLFLINIIGLNKIYDLVMLKPDMFLFLAILFIFDIILFRQLTCLCNKQLLRRKI
ncbi:MAG: HAD-IC family P-type ATPase [Bacilli bacterium]|nr:HAD-IC family P-type ATPase [Bacilli bacterium]